MTTESAARTVCELARRIAARGWLPATSGNLSVRVEAEPLRFAITRSGADKQRLAAEDVILVDGECRAAGGGEAAGRPPFRPSAEAAVHARLYAAPDCGCILHVHTVFNNLVSRLFHRRGSAPFSGCELLKALGHWEERAAVRVPIVDNFHDLARLAQAVCDAREPGVPGVLVLDHGVYAWGRTADDALRHLEALEFLFEYRVRLASLSAREADGAEEGAAGR